MAKRRVRLDKTKAEQTHKPKGKVIKRGFNYKAVLASYDENGREPTIVRPDLPMMKPPLFVTQPTLGKRILKCIRKGYPYTTVCRAVGITTKTLREWLEKGASGYAPEYVEFYTAFCKAEAKGEIRTLEKLRSHERSDWRVSAWQLERRWPEHWSKKDRIVAETHVNTTINVDSKEVLSKTVVNDEEARELARKMIDGDEFGYKRLPSPATVSEDA